MRSIGLITVVLFLAGLGSFFFGFMNPNEIRIFAGLGAMFLAAAALILAITIWRRSKTERI